MQLICQSYGLHLSIKEGKFQIQTPKELKSFPIHEVKSITLYPASKVSHEVIQYCLTHGIDLLFSDKKGNPMGRIWSGAFGSISSIRMGQLHMTQNQEGLQIAKSWIAKKIEHQWLLLFMVPEGSEPQSRKIDRSIQKLKELQTKGPRMDASGVLNASDIFTWEARASAIYWKTLGLSLPEPYQFQKRSRKPSRDMFNAALNYLYGMLYQKIESALIHSGLDPTLGWLHGAGYKSRPSLVFDFIEPYRVWADFLMVDLTTNHHLDKTWFHFNEDEVWLNEEGRAILAPIFNDFLDQNMEDQNGRRRVEELKSKAAKLAKQCLAATKDKTNK